MKRISILFLGICFACSSSDDVIVNQALVEYEHILSYSSSEAEMAFDYVGLPTEDLKHRFNVYEVTYTTHYGEEPVNATALVSIPQTEEESFPIFSFQHGTIAAHREAPSEKLFEQLPFFSLASAGYITVLPDFIGFGESSQYLHPYYVEEPMGKSVVDAIIAAKELVASVEGKFNGDVFLAGYSEGGYATMAAHKYMEENPRADLNLVASAPASGGYDMKGFQEYFFSIESYDQPFFMAYVALAYKSFYGWDDPLSIFFQEPYASSVEQYFSGAYSGSEINAQLTTDISTLLQPEMVANFDTDPVYSHLKEALVDNSLLDWSPEAKMIMYHGTADVTVPYQNSVDSYQALMDNGAKNLTFISIEGATHYSGALPYVRDVYSRFKELK